MAETTHDSLTLDSCELQGLATRRSRIEVVIERLVAAREVVNRICWEEDRDRSAYEPHAVDDHRHRNETHKQDPNHDSENAASSGLKGHDTRRDRNTYRKGRDQRQNDHQDYECNERPDCQHNLEQDVSDEAYRFGFDPVPEEPPTL